MCDRIRRKEIRAVRNSSHDSRVICQHAQNGELEESKKIRLIDQCMIVTWQQCQPYSVGYLFQ